MKRSEIIDLYFDINGKDFITLFRLLEKNKAFEVFDGFDVEQQVEIIKLMETPDTIKLLETLDPDDCARIFEELPAEVAKPLLEKLSPQRCEHLNKLLGYPYGSAGRYMTPRYVSAYKYQSVGEVLTGLHTSPLRADEMGIIFVVDEQQRYQGYAMLGRLLKAEPLSLLENVVERNDVFIYTTDPKTKALEIISEFDIPSLAVIDSEKHLVGAVTFDDVMDVAEEEATDDFHKMATVGTVKTNLKDASIRLLYAKRVPWLLILVFMNIFSGAAIALFEDTIQAVVALVFFLPLLIDSGGNAGAQSSTLVVRSLAMGDVKNKDWFYLIGKEVLVASSIGLTMAIAVAGLGIYRGGWELAIVVSLTMILVVFAGCLIGMTLPFLLNKLKMDPATASAPLITSIADIVGVLIYFSIATWYFGIA
jgi:magnesium transporter